MRYILATKNKGKVAELRKIISGIDFVSMDDAGFHEDIVEDGTTFEENALIKARTVCNALGEAAIADDSGLEVFALDMRPGIFSARYAGENATDAEKVSKLLDEMNGKTDRRARFVCAAALCMPDGKEMVFRGETNGTLLCAAHGDLGFGYDPIFVADGMKKTFAELSSDEKNNISHRKRAFEKLSDEISKGLQL